MSRKRRKNRGGTQTGSQQPAASSGGACPSNDDELIKEIFEDLSGEDAGSLSSAGNSLPEESLAKLSGRSLPPSSKQLPAPATQSTAHRPPPESSAATLRSSIGTGAQAITRDSAVNAEDTRWLRAQIEELSASLEQASERLQRSLQRQGLLEAQAEADRATAERLTGADRKARESSEALARLEGEHKGALERLRALAAEREHLRDEIVEFQKRLAEREQNLGRLAAEGGKERLALLDKLADLHEKVGGLEAARAHAEGEAKALREEIERLNQHLELREKTLADLSRQSAEERERLQSEIKALSEKAEHQAGEMGSLRAESAARQERLDQLRGELDAETARARTLEEEITRTEKRLAEAEAERQAAERKSETAQGESKRLEEERGQLSRLLEERERTLRDELAAARSERESQAKVLQQLQTDYERLGREHERLTQSGLQIEMDMQEALKTANRERDRARGLATEVVTLEERIRELTLQLERARAPRNLSEAEQRRIEQELRKEYERASKEAERLRQESTDLTEQLRANERQLLSLQSARSELERRAEAAETLVRERLREPAPAEAPQVPSVAPQLEAQNRQLEEFSRQLTERLARLEKQAAPPPDRTSSRFDQLEERLGEITARLSEKPAEPKAPEARPFALPGDRRVWLAIGGGALLIIFILGAVLGRAYRNLASQNERLRAMAEKMLVQGGSPAQVSQGTSEPLPLPRLENPSAGSTVRRDRVDLEGSAPGADAVFLFLGDTLFAVELVRRDHFVFRDTPFAEGKNRVALRSVARDGTASDLWESTYLHPAEEGTPAAPAVRDFLRGPRSRQEIVLTFDGDHANGATPILDILRREGIQTTIFLTGKFVDENPEIVRRIVREGHEVGNHTWDHPHLTTFDENSRHETRPEVTKGYFQSQLIRTASRFEEITGVQMAPVWRAPFGEVNVEIMRWARELGYTHVNWTRDYERAQTLDSLDWVSDTDSHNYFTNAEIVQRLLAFGRDKPGGASGGIVLMHLGTNRKPGDALYEKLPDLIRSWREEGYKFVKATKMIQEAEQG